jgi:hypothetical protein
MKKLFLIAIIFSTIFFSCSKKNKLQTDTLTIYVTPSPVVVEPGKSRELQATGKSAKSDNVDINPQWILDPESLGSISPTRGKKTTFTASANTGSGKIKVIEENVYTEVNVTITTQTQSGGGGGSSALILYNDNGLNKQFGTPDIFIWADGGKQNVTASEKNNSGNPIDSQRYQSFTSGVSWFGGGIVLKKENGEPSPVDLSSYSNKTLKFYIRLSRVLVSLEKIKVEIEHTSKQTKSPPIYLSSDYGFDKNSTNWQEISIPLNNFSGVDYTKILLPFECTAENITSTLTLDWDYVRWE